jgi:hypothetical protein
VGQQPLSSSNFNSISNFENEQDFQQFLKGEGSLNPYQPYGVASHSTQPEELKHQAALNVND